MDREIWFEKVLWSYMPCHWKGWAVLSALIISAVGGMFLGQWMLDALGYQGADWLLFPIFFFPTWIAALVIANRHSRRVF